MIFLVGVRTCKDVEYMCDIPGMICQRLSTLPKFAVAFYGKSPYKFLKIVERAPGQILCAGIVYVTFNDQCASRDWTQYIHNKWCMNCILCCESIATCLIA